MESLGLEDEPPDRKYIILAFIVLSILSRKRSLYLSNIAQFWQELLPKRIDFQL